MERISFVLNIDPNRVEEYVERHSRVDPELEQLFKIVGIQHYRIFHHQGLLFALMEVENYDSAMSRLHDHPANVKWQAYMADMLIPWEDGETTKPIREVYRFDS